MHTYVIERNLPGAGALSAAQLRDIAGASNAVLRDLGPEVQWVHSYVTGDKLYCVYYARDAEIVREHARCGGFPADAIHEVKAIIDPTTAGSGAR